jgi:hypothetical protein
MFLPIALALMNWKYLNSPLKIFFWYSMIAFINALMLNLFVWVTSAHYEWCKPYLEHWKIEDTNFLAILAYLNIYIFLGLYFSKEIADQKYRRPILILCTFVGIYGLIDYFFITGFRDFGFFNPTMSSVLTIGLSLISFSIIFATDSLVPLQKNPYFWIVIGLLVPHVVGFLIRLTGSKIYGDDYVLYCQVKIVANVFVIISQILLALGFFHARYSKYLIKRTS